jgi:hypothetical protein
MDGYGSQIRLSVRRELALGQKDWHRFYMSRSSKEGCSKEGCRKEGCRKEGLLTIRCVGLQLIRAGL